MFLKFPGSSPKNFGTIQTLLTLIMIPQASNMFEKRPRSSWNFVEILETSNARSFPKTWLFSRGFLELLEISQNFSEPLRIYWNFPEELIGTFVSKMCRKFLDIFQCFPTFSRSYRSSPKKKIPNSSHNLSEIFRNS